MGRSLFEESAVENVIDIAAPVEKVFDTLERHHRQNEGV
jgi:hypothetical protein